MTFIILGEEILNFMIRQIGKWQGDTDRRKQDYQSIFDAYCRHHDALDKLKFYESIRNYVTEKYEKPRAREEKVTLEQMRRRQSVEARGVRNTRLLRKVETKQTYGPTIDKDFTWKPETCPGCLSKITVIKAYQAYVKQLEEVISKNPGKDYLPAKPEILRNLGDTGIQ